MVYYTDDNSGLLDKLKGLLTRAPFGAGSTTPHPPSIDLEHLLFGVGPELTQQGSGGTLSPMPGTSMGSQLYQNILQGMGNAFLPFMDVAANVPQPPSEKEQILAQLMDLANKGPSLDIEGLLADSAAGINQAFGGQIAGVRHEMQGARADTKEGTQKIQAMYRALAKDMRRSGKQEAKQSNRLAQQLQHLGSQSANAINQQAGQLLEQNAAVAGGLGSPELLAKLNAPVTKQAGRMGGEAIQSAGRQATGQAGLGAVARRFFNTAGGTSRIEGTERASDLIGDLQDYLTGSRDKITEIQGQKAAALAQAKNDLLSTIAQQPDPNQQLIENLMAITGLGMEMDQNEFNNLMAQQEASGGSNFADLMPEGLYKSGEILNQFSQSPEGPAVANLFQQLTQSQPFMQGYVPAPSGYAGSALQIDNPTVLMGLIQQMAGSQNLSPDAIRTLLSALMQYASGIESTAPSYLPGS